MRTILKLTIIIFIFASCGSSRNYQTNEDNAFSQTIKKFNKKPDNAELKTALIQLYSDASKLHLDKIEIYKTLTEADRFEKIIGEYSALQKLHEAVRESDAARQVIQSKDYSADIVLAKEQGATTYYEQAESLMANDDRRSAKAAYNYFRSAQKLVPNFRNTSARMNEAYDKSVVSVVINSVRNNSPYYNTNYGNTTYGGMRNNNYVQDNFLRNLVRDLGGDNNRNSIPARFYTEYDARRFDINPDWEVNLTWIDIDMPRPRTQTTRRNVSRQIQSGSDTAGRPIYQTVTGTITTFRSTYSARGNMEVKIDDLVERRNITSGLYNANLDWQEQYSEYSGNAAALSNSEWEQINNSRDQRKRREEIEEQLYANIYSQIKSKIYTTANW